MPMGRELIVRCGYRPVEKRRRSWARQPRHILLIRSGAARARAGRLAPTDASARETESGGVGAVLCRKLETSLL
jgi:hypothetical protein